MENLSSVFPTPVGVYRDASNCIRIRISFPHARGGVPANPTPGETSQFVFPTPVGVYRDRLVIAVNDVRFPHARGGVPLRCSACHINPAFSPRPWGCTEFAYTGKSKTKVFPTPVGVYRSLRSSTGKTFRFPHARGGVPENSENTLWLFPFSPRPWGCTACERIANNQRVVFPTPVGVYRGRRRVRQRVKTFSPRPWGCTALSGVWRPQRLVFPTPVGVYRAP